MDEETLLAYIQFLMSGGYTTPAAIDLVDPFGGVTPQDPDTFEDGEYGPSTTQARNLTYLKNTGNIMADPILMAQLGPEVFEPSTFEPTYEREEVDMPGRRRLGSWLGQSEGTVERIAADVIAGGGGTYEAFNAIQEIVAANPEDLTPQEQDLQERLMMSIPKRYDFDPVSGQMQELGPNMEQVFSSIQDLTDDLASDPIPDEYSPDELRGWNVTEEPSEIAQHFYDLGLPLPTDRYTLEGLMPQPSEQELAEAYAEQDALDEARNALPGAISDYNRARSRFENRFGPIQDVTAGTYEGAPGGVPVPPERPPARLASGEPGVVAGGMRGQPGGVPQLTGSYGLNEAEIEAEAQRRYEERGVPINVARAQIEAEAMAQAVPDTRDFDFDTDMIDLYTRSLPETGFELDPNIQRAMAEESLYTGDERWSGAESGDELIARAVARGAGVGPTGVNPDRAPQYRSMYRRNEERKGRRELGTLNRTRQQAQRNYQQARRKSMDKVYRNAVDNDLVSAMAALYDANRSGRTPLTDRMTGRAALTRFSRF